MALERITAGPRNQGISEETRPDSTVSTNQLFLNKERTRPQELALYKELFLARLGTAVFNRRVILHAGTIQAFALLAQPSPFLLFM